MTARFLLVVAASWVPLLVAVVGSGRGNPGWFSTAFLLSLGIALAGCVLFTRRLEESINRLERATERFARGDLDVKVYPSRIPQLAFLGRGFNAMAGQLKERVDTLVRLGNEQDGILSSMIEGVITIDPDERIMRLNKAALALLGVTTQVCEGRLVAEVIHHADLQRFARNCVVSGEPSTETICVRLSSERFLEVYACPLLARDGKPFGTLLVFHDVTRVRRLENVRRDFVANVSHELKTPITTIKGFVETLLDGAIADPELSRKFLGIIARHADRLNAIFNDLLTLARLEAEGEGEETHIELEPFQLRVVLQGAVETCAATAQGKGVELRVREGDGLRVMVNPSLMEQAVVNLLDNAVKHTEPGGLITVGAQREGDFAVVKVEDTGCGIEKAHLARLFERFYRVDHGRSRKAGGTGLGLSIVKHIAQVHGGRVEVSSVVGKGSVFSMYVRAA